MLGLTLGLGLSSAAGGGGGGSAFTPFTPIAETQAVIDRFAAVGATAMSGALTRFMDRSIRRIKAIDGGAAWTLLHGAGGALYMGAESEAGMMVNIADPVRNDLVKNGAPTYSSTGFNLAGFVTTSDFYDTGIQLGSINYQSFSMGVLGRDVSSATATIYDVGAVDTGSGIAININAATLSSPAFRGAAAATTTTLNNLNYWITNNNDSSRSLIDIHRRDASSIDYGRHGQVIGNHSAAAVNWTNPTRTLKIGKAEGIGSAPPNRQIYGFYVTPSALSASQASNLAAIMLNWQDGLRYGVPYIEDVGQGAATINADVVIYGLSLSSLCAAYDVKRRNPSWTVVMVGAQMEETVWQLGGMPANGLDWFDIASGEEGRVSGLIRQMIRWIKGTTSGLGYYGIADPASPNQAALSVDPRGWNMCARRMLDPRYSSDTILPGLDIPVYMTGGAASVTGGGGSNATALVTADGRTFNIGKYLFAGEYSGELLPLIAGVTTVQGVEAAGSGAEAVSGYRSTLSDLGTFKNEGTETPLRIDPYVTAGNPGSGLLPDLVVNNTSNQGGADLVGLQGMNYRVPVNYADGVNSTWRQHWAPFVVSGSPPRNYNALRYEFFARAAASATALGETLSVDSVLRADRIGENATYYDMNNLDRPNSGVDWAGSASVAEREAIAQDIEDYIKGAIYYLRHSGDSRLPAALVTAATNYHLNARNFLDPPSWGTLHWPSRVYERVPRWRLVGDFRLDANDLAMANGTTPRNTRTGSSIGYRDDKHNTRWVAQDDGSGVIAFKQGGLSGVTRRVPVTMDVMFTSACPNLAVINAASVTDRAWASFRMEFTLCLLGECAAVAATVADRDAEAALVDVTYTNGTDGVRELMQSAPYNLPAVLPLVNGPL